METFVKFGLAGRSAVPTDVLRASRPTAQSAGRCSRKDIALDKVEQTISAASFDLAQDAQFKPTFAK